MNSCSRLIIQWGCGQVVDERMWGEEDKPEEGQRPGEEKTERDAPVQVRWHD